MSIADKIHLLKSTLPSDVRLVAVSKFHPVEAIQEAYQAGQRIFGESRAQELSAKQKELPNDIEWHFIGPLQSNKVKYIAPFIHTIQSIDSVKLLAEVNKESIKNNRVIQVLLEIHIARESNKHGFSVDECKDILNDNIFALYPNVRICGLMGMATFTDNKDQIRQEFHTLHLLFEELRSSVFKDCDYFTELSMGMTDDYEIAISERSTMVRIGSYIFGEREY